MSSEKYERIMPLIVPPYLFIGKKPVAVLFSEERIEVKSWREVYAVILTRCNQEPDCHAMLMYLRNKAAGKVRIFISDRPDGMTRPLKIDDDMYCETHYGTETLIRILIKRILTPVGFDSSRISITLKEQ